MVWREGGKFGKLEVEGITVIGEGIEGTCTVKYTVLDTVHPAEHRDKGGGGGGGLDDHDLRGLRAGGRDVHILVGGRAGHGDVVGLVRLVIDQRVLCVRGACRG